MSAEGLREACAQFMDAMRQTAIEAGDTDVAAAFDLFGRECRALPLPEPTEVEKAREALLEAVIVEERARLVWLNGSNADSSMNHRELSIAQVVTKQRFKEYALAAEQAAQASKDAHGASGQAEADAGQSETGVGE